MTCHRQFENLPRTEIARRTLQFRAAGCWSLFLPYPSDLPTAPLPARAGSPNVYSISFREGDCTTTKRSFQKLLTSFCFTRCFILVPAPHIFYTLPSHRLVSSHTHSGYRISPPSPRLEHHPLISIPSFAAPPTEFRSGHRLEAGARAAEKPPGMFFLVDMVSFQLFCSRLVHDSLLGLEGASASTHKFVTSHRYYIFELLLFSESISPSTRWKKWKILYLSAWHGIRFSVPIFLAPTAGKGGAAAA